MMKSLFEILITTSLAATLTAAVLLPIKSLMQRLGCPKRMTFWLWGIVALRLICPVLPQTQLSFLGAVHTSASAIAWHTSADRHTKPNEAQNDIKAAVPLPETTQISAYDASVPSGTRAGYCDVLGAIWLCGTAFMLCIGIAAYVRLRYRLRFAICCQNNIWQAEGLKSSFVFGIWHPKIYMPMHLSADRAAFMLAHETMHIKRRDHLVKLLAYVLLCLHWCNPVCWLLYKLFADDMELCCDEAVLATLGQTQRAAYAQALFCGALQMAEPHSPLGTLGFANSIVKRRIRNVMRYRNSTTLGCSVTLLLCVVLAVPFATNAKAAPLRSPAAPTATANPTEKPAAASAAAETDAVHLPSAQPTRPQQTEAPQNTLSTAADTALPVSQPPNKTAEEDNAPESLLLNDTANELMPCRSGEYSTQGDGISREKQLQCGKDGAFLLQLHMNTPCLMRATVYDAATGQEVLSDWVLANGETSYLLSDLEPGKIYDVSLQAATEKDWQIEGQYTLH